MRIGLLLLLLPSFSMASGPKYVGTKTDPAVIQEFQNVYHDINSPSIGVGTASSMTITNLKGTSTNDNACTGCYGEYISTAPAITSFPSNGTFADIASMSLTSGDWDVSLHLDFQQHGSSASDFAIGVSSTSGNSGTGLSNPQNSIQLPANAGSLGGQQGASLPSIRFSLATTTTLYFKVYQDGASGTLPLGHAFMSARRIR